MTDTLSAGDFATFFHEVHGQPPFPWQTRLTHRVAESGAHPTPVIVRTAVVAP